MANTIRCKIEGCEKPVRIKKLGLCQMHETRSRNHGDPNYERKITSPTSCKIENCTDVVYNKNNQLCMKHYQSLRKYGDANHKTQRKSLIPLRIPGGEIICNYPKARQIIGIVSEIEKMVMCGYIDNESSFNSTLHDLIPEQRCSKQVFYTKYIEPILDDIPMLTIYYKCGEKLTKLVDEIIKNGKTTDDSYLKHWDLTSVGIKREGSEYCFSCSDEDVLETLSKLKIDNTNVYEICRKLKIHFRRYIKLQSRIERLV